MPHAYAILPIPILMLLRSDKPHAMQKKIPIQFNKISFIIVIISFANAFNISETECSVLQHRHVYSFKSRYVCVCVCGCRVPILWCVSERQRVPQAKTDNNGSRDLLSLSFVDSFFLDMIFLWVIIVSKPRRQHQHFSGLLFLLTLSPYVNHCFSICAQSVYLILLKRH